MSATYTLASTTLASGIDRDERLLLLASLTGVTVGSCLYITEFFAPGEVVCVMDFGAASGSVKVKRGQFGTAARLHSGTATVFIATAAQLYDFDPPGAPLASPLVNPWINIINGKVWYAYGDENDASMRWWQPMVTTPAIGPLGVRQFPVVGAQ